MAATEEVSQRVAELARTLFAEEGLDESLCRTARLAVKVIPHCDSGSVTLKDANGTCHTRCSTDEVAERVDEHQYEAGEGPCLDAIRTGHIILVPNLEHEDRWLRFVPPARKEGMVSVCSVPLSVGESTVGALNLYSCGASFDDGDSGPAQQLASQAAVTLANAQAFQQARHLVHHLEEALKSRDVIGQAKGIIMERERCTSDHAFEVLRSVSQARNIKLRDVAEMVVMTGTWQPAAS